MTIEYPDRLNNFFKEVETHKTILTTITDTHTKLINTFISLDETLFKRSQILDTQIDDFNKKRQKTLETLDIRETTIPEREASLAASVQNFEEEFSCDDDEKTTTVGILKMFFRRMDSNGLVKFLLEKRRESFLAREDLAKGALDCVDLLTFVLDAVEEFVHLKMSAVKVKGMTDRRWAYGLLTHTALTLPNQGVARSLKERAFKVLEIWKGVLLGTSDGTGSGEATMFLQIVIAFGLKHKFDYQFLMKMVKEFAGGRDMAKFALALGFGDKMGEIIEELVKKGKEIEAVYFAHEAGLTEHYPPVPLLESSLKKYREITCKVSSSLDDVSNEMSVIRTVIKCIEDNKLESQFTTADLQTRLSELDKIKSRKRSGTTTSTSTPLNKRSRSERGRSGSSRPPKAVRLALARKKLLTELAPHQQSAGTVSSPYSSYGVDYRHPSSQTSGNYGLQYPYPSQDIDATATRGDGYGTYDYASVSLPASFVPAYPTTNKF
ncbi:FRIGIDA-like protein 4a [Tanacetum coccineum]